MNSYLKRFIKLWGRGESKPKPITTLPMNIYNMSSNDRTKLKPNEMVTSEMNRVLNEITKIKNTLNNIPEGGGGGSIDPSILEEYLKKVDAANTYALKSEIPEVTPSIKYKEFQLEFVSPNPTPLALKSFSSTVAELDPKLFKVPNEDNPVILNIKMNNNDLTEFNSMNKLKVELFLQVSGMTMDMYENKTYSDDPNGEKKEIDALTMLSRDYIFMLSHKPISLIGEDTVNDIINNNIKLATTPMGSYYFNNDFTYNKYSNNGTWYLGIQTTRIIEYSPNLFPTIYMLLPSPPILKVFYI